MLLSLFPIYLFSQVFIHLAFNRLTSKKLKIRKYCYRHSLCRISKQPASLLANTELIMMTSYIYSEISCPLAYSDLPDLKHCLGILIILIFMSNNHMYCSLAFCSFLWKLLANFYTLLENFIIHKYHFNSLCKRPGPKNCVNITAICFYFLLPRRVFISLR